MKSREDDSVALYTRGCKGATRDGTSIQRRYGCSKDGKSGCGQGGKGSGTALKRGIDSRVTNECRDRQCGKEEGIGHDC